MLDLTSQNYWEYSHIFSLLLCYWTCVLFSHSKLLPWALHKRKEWKLYLDFLMVLGQGRHQNNWPSILTEDRWVISGYWPKWIGQQVNLSMVNWCSHPWVSRTIVFSIILYALIGFFRKSASAEHLTSTLLTPSGWQVVMFDMKVILKLYANCASNISLSLNCYLVAIILFIDNSLFVLKSSFYHF